MIRSKKARVRTAVVFIALLLIFQITASLPSFAQGNSSYITQITFERGEDALTALQKNGYKAVMRPVNSNTEDPVYLGYKTDDGEVITGIIASEENADSIEANGITYHRVSDVSITGSGTPKYMYQTTDAKAGAGITDLLLFEEGEYIETKPSPLLNDGSQPLRMNTGEIANLRDDSKCTYLFIRRSDVCRPYISDMKVVYGEDQAQAVLNCVREGCDYFYDTGISDNDNGYLVIGYNRSADVNEALTYCIADTEKEENSNNKTLKTENGDIEFILCADTAVKGEKEYYLFYTKDRKAGNPVLSLTGSEVPKRSTDIMGSWIEMTFSNSLSYMSESQLKNDDLYNELIKSEESLVNVPVLLISDDNAKTPFALKCEEKNLNNPFVTNQKESTQSTEQSESVEEDMTSSEYLNESVEAAEQMQDNTASVFGNGDMRVILIVGAALLFLFGLVFVFFIKRERRGRSDKKD